MPEPIPIRPQRTPGGELDALAEITEAVESGLGLPEVVRAAARALDASLVLIDRSSAVLAVAARSTADERALMADAAGVATHELRVGDALVGRLRVRGRSGEPPAALLSAVLRREVTDRGDIVARAAELGVDGAGGAALVVVRARHYAPAGED